MRPSNKKFKDLVIYMNYIDAFVDNAYNMLFALIQHMSVKIIYRNQCGIVDIIDMYIISFTRYRDLWRFTYCIY